MRNSAFYMGNVRVNLRFLIFTIYLSYSVVINPLIAQVENYVGIETTVAKDLYDYTDLYESTDYDGAGLKLKPVPSYSGGINWGWRFNDNFSIEAGILIKQYTIAFGYNNERDKASKISESFGVIYRFPIRFRYQLDLIPDKLYFLPCVGISVAFDGNTGYVSHVGNGSLLDVNETYYDYYYHINTLTGTLVNPFWSIEGSMGLGAPFGRAVISVHASLLTGLNQVHAGNFTYNSDVNNIVQRVGVLTGSGDYVGITANFIYQLKK